MIHVKYIIKKINYLKTIGIYKLNQGDHLKKFLKNITNYCNRLYFTLHDQRSIDRETSMPLGQAMHARNTLRLIRLVTLNFED